MSHNKTFPKLQTRGSLSPKTADPETRTIEVVWGTSDPAIMRSWEGQYTEVLSFADGHVDLSRLNAGAPVLNTHSTWDLSDVIGVVESARIEGGKGIATLRFSKRENVDPIWQDIQDGIIRNVSVGYSVRKYEVTEPKDGKLQQRKAVDWLPMEISMVPIGKDAKAQTRSEDIEMEDEILETAPQQVEATVPTATQERAQEPTPTAGNPVDLDRAVAQAIRAERERTSQIRAYGEAAGCNSAYIDALINQGVTSERAAGQILSDAANGQFQINSTRLEVTRPEGENLMRALEGALLYRMGVETTLPDEAKQFHGMSLVECAREVLQRRGINTYGMSKNDLAIRAISTDDFPILFTALTRRTLLPAYEQAPQTWRMFASQTNLPDFRPYQEVDLSADMYPRLIVEGGEYQRSVFVTAEGAWQLLTYGREFVITRQAIVNDDLGSLNRIPMYMGRAFADFESDQIWRMISYGGTTLAGGVGINMPDGTPLFDPAHRNVATGGMTVEGLGEARRLFRTQRDIAGNLVVLQPETIVVPSARETEAEVFLGPIVPNTVGGVNPFTNKFKVVAEPRLDPIGPDGQPLSGMPTFFYVFGSPSQVPMIQFGYLQGEAGPLITSTTDRNPDGMTMLSRFDFGCTIQNFRGMVKVTN